jgi:hypothetical protein
MCWLLTHVLGLVHAHAFVSERDETGISFPTKIGNVTFDPLLSDRCSRCVEQSHRGSQYSE